MNSVANSAVLGLSAGSHVPYERLVELRAAYTPDADVVVVTHYREISNMSLVGQQSCYPHLIVEVCWVEGSGL
jgi:hypothetical protein